LQTTCVRGRIIRMADFRFARPSDIPILIPLMQDFYLYERLPFDAVRTERLLNELLANEMLGRLVLFESQGEEAQERTLAGYMVLTFGYSLEFGGRDALIDEFYVVPEARAAGIGADAIAHAAAICRELGISNVHLAVDYFNERVHGFYKRLGFRDHERHWMTLSI
jgi:GNAT superfamily N-acetyltransferase